MLNSLKNTLFLSLSALALTAPSAGQIPLQPDNLWSGGFYSNPLCSNAPLSLPTFPGFKQVSLEIGWQDCQLGSQKPVDAQWSAPMRCPPAAQGPAEAGQRVQIRCRAELACLAQPLLGRRVGW